MQIFPSSFTHEKRCIFRLFFCLQAAADWVFSNQMQVPVGKTVYTCMLNKRAGIEADLTVSVLGSEKVINHLFFYHPSFLLLVEPRVLHRRRGRCCLPKLGAYSHHNSGTIIGFFVHMKRLRIHDLVSIVKIKKFAKVRNF